MLETLKSQCHMTIRGIWWVNKMNNFQIKWTKFIENKREKMDILKKKNY